MTLAGTGCYAYLNYRVQKGKEKRASENLLKSIYAELKGLRIIYEPIKEDIMSVGGSDVIYRETIIAQNYFGVFDSNLNRLGELTEFGILDDLVLSYAQFKLFVDQLIFHNHVLKKNAEEKRRINEKTISQESKSQLFLENDIEPINSSKQLKIVCKSAGEKLSDLITKIEKQIESS